MDVQPWWPAVLGTPTAIGAQNHLRYAYFAAARRLVVDAEGHITIYDTLDHRISGVSQRQSVGQTLTFTSQRGPVALNKLPVLRKNRRHESPHHVQPFYPQTALL